VSEKRVETAMAGDRSWSDEVCAIAHTLGIEYVPDHGPTWPGDLHSILEEIRRLKRRSVVLDDLQHTCHCGSGTAESYDGPNRDCPIHGESLPGQGELPARQERDLRTIGRVPVERTRSSRRLSDA
jgi:hypothetical protein